MRYYKGKPMKDYKPKWRVRTVEAFIKRMAQVRTAVRVRGNTAIDADGDVRITLIN